MTGGDSDSPGAGTVGPRTVTPRPRHGVVVTYLAFLLVLAVAAAGFVYIWTYRWRRGAVTIGGSLLLAAGLRAVLPERGAGLLAIRGRAIDVISYTAFGLALVGVAVTID